MSTRTIINMAVGIMVGILMFTVAQQILDAQTTTTWSALSVTLAFLLPSVFLIVLVVYAFQKITGRGGN